MGFTPEPSILKIVFDEDTPLHGLVIRARACTIGQWNEMLRWGDTSERKTTKDTADGNEKISRLLLEHIVEWNLEIPAGHPVPITEEGWNKLDNSWGASIVAAWQYAMVGVPTILPKGSSSGETSAEQSLGLANISESLPNWPGPS